MVTIATYTHSDEAHLARSRLEGSGVYVEVEGDVIASVNPLYANAIGGIELRVPSEQVPYAREVLGLPPVTEKGVTRCPHCASSNVDYRRLPFLVVLLIIVLGFLFPFFRKTVRCLDCKTAFAPDESRE